jgi:hypothetical protein
MRSSILVEEGVQEEQAALRDGRRVRHERNFSEPPRTGVGLDETLQYFLALGGASLHNLSALESDVNPFDHGSLMRQRL